MNNQIIINLACQFGVRVLLSIEEEEEEEEAIPYFLKCIFLSQR